MVDSKESYKFDLGVKGLTKVLKLRSFDQTSIVLITSAVLMNMYKSTILQSSTSHVGLKLNFWTCFRE